jgi:hypothetical protein
MRLTVHARAHSWPGIDIRGRNDVECGVWLAQRFLLIAQVRGVLAGGGGGAPLGELPLSVAAARTSSRVRIRTRVERGEFRSHPFDRLARGLPLLACVGDAYRCAAPLSISICVNYFSNFPQQPDLAMVGR